MDSNWGVSKLGMVGLENVKYTLIFITRTVTDFMLVCLPILIC